MMLYIDTSALLRVALSNQKTLLEHLQQAPTWIASALTFVEAERVLVGKRHGPRNVRLTQGQFSRAHTVLRAVAYRTDTAAMDYAILERAVAPFPVEPLRTADAIHLATALRWAQEGPVQVLSTDERLLENARALGLLVAGVTAPHARR